MLGYEEVTRRLWSSGSRVLRAPDVAGEQALGLRELGETLNPAWGGDEERCPQ